MKYFFYGIQTMFLFLLFIGCGDKGGQAPAPTTGTAPQTAEGEAAQNAPSFSNSLITGESRTGDLTKKIQVEFPVCMERLFAVLERGLLGTKKPDGTRKLDSYEATLLPPGCRLAGVFVRKFKVTKRDANNRPIEFDDPVPSVEAGVSRAVGFGFHPDGLKQRPTLESFSKNFSEVKETRSDGTIVTRSQVTLPDGSIVEAPKQCSKLIEVEGDFIDEFGATQPSQLGGGAAEDVICGAYKIFLCLDCTALVSAIQSPILFSTIAAAQGFLGPHTPPGNFRTEGIITQAQALANGLALTFAPGVIISSLFFKFLKGDVLKFVTSVPFSQQTAPDGTIADVTVNKKLDGSTEVTFEATRSSTSDVDRMAIIGFGSDGVGDFVTGAGIGLPL